MGDPEVAGCVEGCGDVSFRVWLETERDYEEGVTDLLLQ